MPIINNTSYKPPALLYNGFWQTVVPGLLPLHRSPKYKRERMELEDGDFLDLDWLRNDGERLIVITHGLEGSSNSNYVRSAVRVLSKEGFDLLAWNCRSCSGELNRNRRLYYHGEIDDLELVLERASEEYRNIGLLGFSMGGNIILKWLGLRRANSGLPVKAGVAVSVPCDLDSASKTLDRPENLLFRYYFTYQLWKKVRKKARQFPEWVDLSTFWTAKKWRDIDEDISAPINNLSSADEFYKESSGRNFIDQLEVPTLIINAENDPLLSPSCNPREIAQNHPFLYLELTVQGGHVGFPVDLRLNSFASTRSVDFFHKHT